MTEARAERRCGHRHVFKVSANYEFLPDAVAVAKATEALAAQGFDTNRWKILPYAQTRAPDGTKDIYLCRHKLDEKRGTVAFTNADGKTRWVHMRLTNDIVICVVDPARSF
jgi:hypothetical protein